MNMVGKEATMKDGKGDGNIERRLAKIIQTILIIDGEDSEKNIIRTKENIMQKISDLKRRGEKEGAEGNTSKHYYFTETKK